MKKFISSVLPRGVKDKILLSKYSEEKEAKRLAISSKRLDICAAQFAHGLHLSGIKSLSGKTCVEIGSGWVLSHALICHLLGAEKVIATDIFPHAHPTVLKDAVHSAIPSVVRDLLSPFEKHQILRDRLNGLLSLDEWDFGTLRKLGIEYKAPFDFSREQLDQPVDYIFSNSVLEHVPCDAIKSLLENMNHSLIENGEMIHCIHMEDHQSIADDPFRFLGELEKNYTPDLQSLRGNRVRKSQWLAEFDALENSVSQCIYSWQREDRDIPENIDSTVKYEDRDDIKVSHIGMYTKKVSV